MKITVTTDDGILIEQFNSDDIGDLNRPIARGFFWEDLKVAMQKALKAEKEEWEKSTGLKSDKKWRDDD